jgi:5-methylcytosine-specific restriction endonuclease McrA
MYKNGSRQTGGRCYRQSQSLKKFIRERDKYTCQLCGKEGWIVDHKIPWAITHDSTISNLRVLCHSCNLKIRRKRKDANPYKHLSEWFAALEVELVQEEAEPK